MVSIPCVYWSTNLCLKHLRNAPASPTPCWNHTSPNPFVQISCITWKVHVFLPFSCKWISILYAFFGKRKILSQNLIQRTAIRMKIGNLARSPSTVAFGVCNPTLRSLLQANKCAFSIASNRWYPHISDPYISTGRIWASYILKNTSLCTLPSLQRHFSTCAVLAFAFVASSFTVWINDNLGVKRSPKYL